MGSSALTRFDEPRAVAWAATERRGSMADDEDDMDWGEEGPPPGLVQPIAADSGAARTARYADRRRHRGELRVSVWVPADRVDELQAIAEQMRRNSALIQR